MKKLLDVLNKKYFLSILLMWGSFLSSAYSITFYSDGSMTPEYFSDWTQACANGIPKVSQELIDAGLSKGFIQGYNAKPACKFTFIDNAYNTGIRNLSINGNFCPDGQVPVQFSSPMDCEVANQYFLHNNDLNKKTPKDPKLCSDDTKSGHSPSTYTTNPINTTDGNKTRQENDFIASGLSPLNFIRYYSSNKNKDSGIGINWSHSYTASLTANIHTAATPYVAGDSNFSGLNSTAALACTSGWNDIKTTYNKPELASSTAVYLNNECSIEDGSGQALGSIAVRDNSTGGVSPNPPQDNIVIERANGNTIIFTLINSVWTPPTDSDVSLVQTTTGYTLTTAQDTVEEYNLTGQLISTTDRKGIQQTYSYNRHNGTIRNRHRFLWFIVRFCLCWFEVNDRDLTR